MIYLDSSVAIAELLTEERRPPDVLWEERLVSSRLIDYEVRVRLNARRLGAEYMRRARALIDRLDLIELSPTVLARALEPFPLAVRTLDALHLASMDFLRQGGRTIEVASYDKRLIQAAAALGFPIFAR